MRQGELEHEENERFACGRLTRTNERLEPPRNPLQYSWHGCILSTIFFGDSAPMLIVYLLVSKSDGSQTLAPNAMRCSRPASRPSASTKTSPPRTVIGV
jgi:hypothetical protein